MVACLEEFSQIMLALQKCTKVSIYGFHWLAGHAIPHHYFNSEVPLVGKSSIHDYASEYENIKALAQEELVNLAQPCVAGCEVRSPYSDYALWCRFCISRTKPERGVQASGYCSDVTCTGATKATNFSSSEQICALLVICSGSVICEMIKMRDLGRPCVCLMPPTNCLNSVIWRFKNTLND